MNRIFLPIFVILLFSSCNIIDNQVEISGTIRKYKHGWDFIDDEFHKPLNVSYVKTTETTIFIYYNFKAKSIHTFIINPDETYTGIGVTAGASVGTSYAAITLYKEINGIIEIIDPWTLNESSGNFWFFGIFTE